MVGRALGNRREATWHQVQGAVHAVGALPPPGHRQKQLLALVVGGSRHVWCGAVLGMWLCGVWRCGVSDVGVHGGWRLAR